MDTNTNKWPNRAAVGLPYRKGQTSVITGIAIIQSDTALKMSLGAGGLQSGLQVLLIYMKTELSLCMYSNHF